MLSMTRIWGVVFGSDMASSSARGAHRARCSAGAKHASTRSRPAARSRAGGLCNRVTLSSPHPPFGSSYSVSYAVQH